jgi:hypothetical protein
VFFSSPAERGNDASARAATGLSAHHWQNLGYQKFAEQRLAPENSLFGRKRRILPPETDLSAANPRKYRHFSEDRKILGRDRGGWLGRQDSNLGMAESKST